MKKIYRTSPFGTLEFVFFDDKLSELNIADSDTVITSSHKLSLLEQKVVRQMEEYFAGTRKIFDIDITFKKGTEFEQQVWTSLLDIPYGKHVSYTDVAIRVGKDYKAARAIGRAVGQNPIAIIVPCHRVIGKSGKLTGFAWGIERKVFLIQLEQKNTIGAQGTLF